MQDFDHQQLFWSAGCCLFGLRGSPEQGKHGQGSWHVLIAEFFLQTQ